MSLVLIYLLFLAAEQTTEITLEILNIRKARSLREIPRYLEGYTDRETFSRAIDYTAGKGWFSVFSSVFNSLLLLAVIFTGILGHAESFFIKLAGTGYVSGILIIYSVFFVLSLVSMPLKVYSEFVIEKKFGFSRMTPSIFAADYLKGILVSLVLSFPLLLALFWFMDKTGNFWWVFAFVFTSLFEITVSFLYPVLIAPLFNRFEKLPDGTLREKIFALSASLGFTLSGIFTMDGSRRSGHSNAYFTGLGRHRRIVLYDTLINSLSEDEIVSVMAHEIGHYKKRHLLKGMALSLALLFAAFFILDMLLHYAPLYTAFGFSRPGYYGILIIAALFSSPFVFFLNPLFNLLSRKHEFEADRFAVGAAGTSVYLKNALLRLGKDNLSNPSPHPLYSFYHYSHPALEERINSMEKAAAEMNENVQKLQ